jgi:hypothetical protein
MSKPTRTEANSSRWQGLNSKSTPTARTASTFSFFAPEIPWEFRTVADAATVAKPGYPECVALIVEIGDHLSKQLM